MSQTRLLIRYGGSSTGRPSSRRPGGGSLLALTGADANRARELIRRREARESRARRYAETGWTAEDERLEARDNARRTRPIPCTG